MGQRRFGRARPLRRRAGLVLVEYALLLGLLVVAALGAYCTLADKAHQNVVGYGNAVASCLESGPSGSSPCP